MKKVLVNSMAIIGVATIIAALCVIGYSIKVKYDEKANRRNQNEYIYTQVDEFLDGVHADKAITIEKLSTGDYKVTYNNGYVDYKYGFVRNGQDVEYCSK